MDRIKIITDSSSDLPADVAKKYDIEVVPLSINFGSESYEDGIDIDIHTLFQRVKHGDIFPTTSQVAPQKFYNCFKKYLDKGNKIICILISSKMSGTYQSACIAKDMLNSEDITVIDSLNVTSGLGLLALKAYSLKEHGLNVKQIEEKIKEIIPHINCVFAFDTLEYLVRGGRLSKTAGIIGSILGVKLIINIKDGELRVTDKVRGSKKCIRYMFDYIEKIGIKEGENSILLNVENEDILDSLKADLKEKKIEFLYCEVGCTVGVHTGPGACGVFFIEKY